MIVSTKGWRRPGARFIGPPGSPRFCSPLIEPAVDVYETNNEVVVVVELAGIADQEVEIIVNGREIIVRGERAALQGQPRPPLLPDGDLLRHL